MYGHELSTHGWMLSFVTQSFVTSLDKKPLVKRMELKIVAVSTEDEKAMVHEYSEIHRTKIDLPDFARSLFCVHFTHPLFERTIPPQLSAAWRRHQLASYPSGEQLMSHLDAISSDLGVPTLLDELCKHWTRCVVTTCAQLTPVQVDVLKFEASYMNGINLLTAEVVNQTLLFSDDISHLWKQRHADGIVFVHVQGNGLNPAKIYGVSIEKIRDQHSAVKPLRHHLPNYDTPHWVVKKSGEFVYYKDASKRFRELYESGLITRSKRGDGYRDISGTDEHVTRTTPWRPAQVAAPPPSVTKAAACTSPAVGAPVSSAKCKPESGNKSSKQLVQISDDDRMRKIVLTDKCRATFNEWRDKGENFREERYKHIEGRSLRQIVSAKIKVTKTKTAFNAHKSEPYHLSDLKHDIRRGFVELGDSAATRV